MDILSKETKKLLRDNPQIMVAVHSLVDSINEEAEVILKDGRKIIIRKVIM